MPSLSEIQQWDTEEVAVHLEKVGLGECCHVFKKRNVNGSALLNLSEDKLLLWSQDLKVIHIRKLSRLISELKQQLIEENGKSKKQESRPKTEERPVKVEKLKQESKTKADERPVKVEKLKQESKTKAKDRRISIESKQGRLEKEQPGDAKLKTDEKVVKAVNQALKVEQAKERRISLESRRGRFPKDEPSDVNVNQRKSFPLGAETTISQTIAKTLFLAEERGWTDFVQLDVDFRSRKESVPFKSEAVVAVASPPPPLVKVESSFMVCHRQSGVVTSRKQQVIDGDYEIPEPVSSIHVQNLINSAGNQMHSISNSGTIYMPVIVSTDSGPSLIQPGLKRDSAQTVIVDSNQECESVYVTLSEEDEEDKLQRELQFVDGSADDGYEIPDNRQTEDGQFSPLPEDLKIEPPAAFSFNFHDGIPCLPPRGDNTPPPRPLPLSPKQMEETKNDDTSKGKSGLLETFKKISGSRFFPTSNQPMSNMASSQKQGSVERERPVITKAQISSPKVVNTLPALPDRPPLLPARVSPNSTPPLTPKQSGQGSISPVHCQQKSASGLRPLPPLPQCSSPQGEENNSPSVTNPLFGRPWYQPICRKEAEVLVKQGLNGTFLIRDSKHGGPSNPFTLSLLYESRVFHIFVRRRLDGSYALGSEKEHEMKFSTIDAMVVFYQKEPLQLYCEGKPAGSTPLVTWPSGA